MKCSVKPMRLEPDEIIDTQISFERTISSTQKVQKEYTPEVTGAVPMPK